MVIHDDCSAFSLMALTMMLFISVSMMLTTTMMLDDDECPPLFDDDDADDDHDVDVDVVNDYADCRRLFPILMMARL